MQPEGVFVNVFDFFGFQCGFKEDNRILDRRCIVKALINCFCKQDEFTNMVVDDKVK